MTGLRERKKTRAREQLVATALELCETQGFDTTTIDQISDAADMSPRTFHRYFRSKEDAILAPIQGIAAAVVVALDAQPVAGNEIEALVTAQIMVLTGRGPFGSIDLTQFEMMNRITRSAPSVDARRTQIAAESYQDISAKVAERLGVSSDDTRVQVVVSVFTSLIQIAATTWRDREVPGTTDSAALAETLSTIFEDFREISR